MRFSQVPGEVSRVLRNAGRIAMASLLLVKPMRCDRQPGARMCYANLQRRRVLVEVSCPQSNIIYLVLVPTFRSKLHACSADGVRYFTKFHMFLFHWRPVELSKNLALQ